jgi:hypothetical protein
MENKNKCGRCGSKLIRVQGQLNGEPLLDGGGRPVFKIQCSNEECAARVPSCYGSYNPDKSFCKEVCWSRASCAARAGIEIDCELQKELKEEHSRGKINDDEYRAARLNLARQSSLARGGSKDSPNQPRLEDMWRRQREAADRKTSKNRGALGKGDPDQYKD